MIFLVLVQWSVFSKATPSQTNSHQRAPPTTNWIQLSLQSPPELLAQGGSHHLHLLLWDSSDDMNLNSYQTGGDSELLLYLARNLWATTNAMLIKEKVVLCWTKSFTDTLGEAQKYTVCTFLAIVSVCFCLAQLADLRRGLMTP